ncbi:MAG: PEGA domain-containing protein [Armatimonadetes bacterium]|nr:PEGA domain-containing protein [Armatimonadota bacterium]
MRRWRGLVPLVGLAATYALADEGSIVSIVHEHSTGHVRIEAMSPDGGQRVVRLQPRLYFGGSFSGMAACPDGRRVALVQENPRSLFVLEPGQRLRRLEVPWSAGSDEPCIDSGPLMWTLDGRGLAFVSSSTSVYATNADGTFLRMLHTGENYVTRLGFDLDGRLLVERYGGYRAAVDVETARATQLGLSDAEAETLLAMRPVRSPDGLRVAYHWRGEVLVRETNGHTRDLTGGRVGAVWPLFWTASQDSVVCGSPEGKVWEVPLGPDTQPQLLTRRAVPVAEGEGRSVHTAWTAVPVEAWLPPSESPAPAVVNVTSEPSEADVFIDEYYKGRTPLQARILSAGEMAERHRIAVVKDNLQGANQRIVAAQGQSQNVHVQLSEPLTDPQWPREVAHVRNEVRRAILHRSPQLLGRFSAPDVVFEQVSSEQVSLSESRTDRRQSRGRLPFPEAVRFLFGEFRTSMLDSPEYFDKSSRPGDRGWDAGFGGGFGCELSIEQRDGKWCITRVYEWHGDQ